MSCQFTWVIEGSAYATKPPGMAAIQQRVFDAQGLHIVTPEYNVPFLAC